MDVLLIVDMQEGMRRSAAKHDLEGVIDRINGVAARVRDRGGRVVLIQHAGSDGDDFVPQSSGWHFLEGLRVNAQDIVISKTLNDPFVRSTLAATLDELRVSRILIAGWATDFCVDACVRSAVAYGRPVVAVSDGHTSSDRPHLTAEQVIEHHNWVWSGLIAPHGVQVTPAREL